MVLNFSESAQEAHLCSEMASFFISLVQRLNLKRRRVMMMLQKCTHSFCGRSLADLPLASFCLCHQFPMSGFSILCLVSDVHHLKNMGSRSKAPLITALTVFLLHVINSSFSIYANKVAAFYLPLLIICRVPGNPSSSPVSGKGSACCCGMNGLIDNSCRSCPALLAPTHTQTDTH